MELSVAPEVRVSQLAALVADRLGLHYPADRRTDLRRAMAAVAKELGLSGADECLEALLSGPPREACWQALAGQLTVGETYFFRDRKLFEALATLILPELIRDRRGRGRRLRIWSAGCCTGEEPYSIAILLRQMLPDLAEWRVTILGTDLNERFLAKARCGTYGNWSFRDAPAGIKERYFDPSPEGRLVLRPEIRGMVTFAPLNLAEDGDQPLATSADAMDLILCRNVLMYFTPERTRQVIARLHRSLAPDGWLTVSPSEASHALFTQFTARNFPGGVAYQKSRPPKEQKAAPPAPWTKRSIAPAPVLPAPRPPKPGPKETKAAAGAANLEKLARARADQGRLDEDRAACDQWVGADKLNPAAHYLRGVVLMEQGDSEAGRLALEKAVYLDPGFTVAHFALGHLARNRKNSRAARHFGNALKSLAGRAEDEVIPESDGLTARQLAGTLAALIGPEGAA